MCRGKRTCTELGADPEAWPTDAPLMPPKWFDEQLKIFTKAVRLVAMSDVAAGEALLRTIRSQELQNWFIEHGHVSGWIRRRHFPMAERANLPERDSRSALRRIEDAVLKRDGYRCRYCGLSLIAKSVLKAFSKVVDPRLFCAAGTNLERHGIALVFRANVDHVLPWNHGGRTEIDNLVSACQGCNYGKASYTLDEIGIVDPRNRSASKRNSWVGLTSYLQRLQGKIAPLDAPVRRRTN